MNWDDLKFFLMVSRTGSIRAAASALGVNHATVSRRINSFEESLGERLFERSAKGYTCTAAGEEIFLEASYLEERLNRVERRVAGNNQTMSGDIRVTLPDLIASRLLMPDFADFCELYPDIELEIIESASTLNLANREADVALRLCDKPPEYLVGRRLARLHRSCYVSRQLLPKFEAQVEHAGGAFNWIGWDDKMRRPVGEIAKNFPRFNSKHKIMSAQLQEQACVNGMGVGVLLCFCGDTNPDLVRIPPYTSEAKYDLWILNHPDMRDNAKIKTFIHFMIDRINDKKALIEGGAFTSPPS